MANLTGSCRLFLLGWLAGCVCLCVSCGVIIMPVMLLLSDSRLVKMATTMAARARKNRLLPRMPKKRPTQLMVVSRGRVRPEAQHGTTTNNNSSRPHHSFAPDRGLSGLIKKPLLLSTVSDVLSLGGIRGANNPCPGTNSSTWARLLFVAFNIESRAIDATCPIRA